MWKNNIRADEPLTLCKYTLIQSQENLLSKSMGMCWDYGQELCLKTFGRMKCSHGRKKLFRQNWGRHKQRS